MLRPTQKAQLRLAAKRSHRPKANVGARNPVGEMGHLRRLGGRWSALGGARRPRPAPAAAHRPCRSPGPHPAHSGPRTTAQAATRGQIRPPWAQIGWLQRACHGHVSVVCGQPTCPCGPGAGLRVPWGHARWCGVLGRPWGGSIHGQGVDTPLCSIVPAVYCVARDARVRGVMLEYVNRPRSDSRAAPEGARAAAPWCPSNTRVVVLKQRPGAAKERQPKKSAQGATAEEWPRRERRPRGGRGAALNDDPMSST